MRRHSRYLLAALAAVVFSGPAYAQSGNWQQLAPAFGTGSAVCNQSRNLYACFALRCGAGRGAEFAFLFNTGDYGAAPGANIGVDATPVAGVPFTAIDRSKELVAPYDPVVHASLIAALKSGSVLEFDIGHPHRFSLRGSSAAIERTLAACAAEIGPGQVAARDGAVGAEEMRAKVTAIIAAYLPSGEVLDPATLAPVVDLISTPRFGSIDLSQLKLQPNPDAAFAEATVGPRSFQVTHVDAREPKHRFIASPAHAKALAAFDTTHRGETTKAQADELFRLLEEARAEVKPGPALAAVLELEALTRSRQFGPFAFRYPGAAAVADLWRQAATEYYKAARDPRFDADLADHITFALIKEARERSTGSEYRACYDERADRVAGIWLEAVGVDLALRKPSSPVLAWLRQTALCTRQAGRRFAIMKERARLAASLGNRTGIDIALADLGLAALLANDIDTARRAYRQAFAVYLAANPRDYDEPDFLVRWEKEVAAQTHMAALRQLGLDAELDHILARRLANYMAEWDLESTVGQSYALGMVKDLEAAGRADLADDFYGYLLTLYGNTPENRPLNRTFMMSLYGEQMLDIELYDLSEGVLRRALKRAAKGDPANRSILLIQLARLEDERGNLVDGLAQARSALREIKSGSVELNDYDLAPLRDIFARTAQEQGRPDRAARQIAAEMARELPQACKEGGKTYRLADVIPVARLLSDPPIADALVREPAVADYIRCVESGLDRFPVETALYFLGLMNERETADRILMQLFDNESSLSPTNIGQAIQGLRWARKAEWINPYLDALSQDFLKDIGKSDPKYPLVDGDVGLTGIELLAIGRMDMARVIYENAVATVLKSPAFDECGLYTECDYLAIMAEAFGDPKDAQTHHDRIPTTFISQNSGAQADTAESKAIADSAIGTALMYEQAGFHRWR